jgi:glyoxylase-like metal-dependent hydrolase (beta-lactamase superfamily II)
VTGPDDRRAEPKASTGGLNRDPGATATWEAYAIRYGRHERTAQHNHLLPVADPHEAMPLDYFVWLLRNPATGHDVVVDTGFDEECAARRGRTISRPVAECLRAMGSDPARVRDVVITHLHYDHAGSIGLFPDARIHIQDREMAFATGRHMCTACIRLPFEAEHVVAMVRALFADKVQFHDGEGEVAPGVTLHRVGGHSDGLQVVRVETATGPLVLASDAMHFYANESTGNPFPIIFDLGAMTQGWRIARRLAGGDMARVIPGHDPAVRTRFPRVPGQGEEVVALHLGPVE